MSTFSVTTPVTERSLLTAEELRAAAGVTGSSQDAALLAMGRSASTAIGRACNIVDDGVHEPTLLEEECTETMRWDGCGAIRLSRRPVTSITNVAIGGVLAVESAYEISGGRSLVHLTNDAVTSWPSAKIVVVYKAGYALAPSDLKLAAAKLVTALWAERGRDPSLKRDTVEGVGTQEFWVAPSGDPLLSAEISDLLASYREYWL